MRNGKASPGFRSGGNSRRVSLERPSVTCGTKGLSSIGNPAARSAPAIRPWHAFNLPTSPLSPAQITRILWSPGKKPIFSRQKLIACSSEATAFITGMILRISSSAVAPKKCRVRWRFPGFTHLTAGSRSRHCFRKGAIFSDTAAGRGSARKHRLKAPLIGAASSNVRALCEWSSAERTPCPLKTRDATRQNASGRQNRYTQCRRALFSYRRTALRSL